MSGVQGALQQGFGNARDRAKIQFQHHHCDRTLLLLLRTFLDIIALRKGPEQVPRSWLLLSVAVMAMLGATFSAMVLINALGRQDYLATIATNLLGVLFYALVLIVAGRSRRILQTLTSVIGCGAILSFLFVAEFVLFRPFLGTGIASIVATLIIFWSVPVEGHIISRAIDKHWFVGIAIAIAAFVLQLFFQLMLTVRS